MPNDHYYAEGLKTFKGKYPPSAQLLEEVRVHNRRKAAILKSVKDAAKSVPEIAEETAIPSELVLWYLAGLKKYGQIEEEGKKGSYYTYKKKGK